jgi:hypothetical protein
MTSLLRAGIDRSLRELPGPISFLAGELRELAVYFTVGTLLLALPGLGRLPRRVWLLALMGLDEVLFIRWAHEHDFLTFPLAPFFALAAVYGVESLWTTPAKRWLARGLLGLAAVQSVWITGDRLTRTGASEIYYRAGLAIRAASSPNDRVLLTIPDVRQFTPYYARRYTAAIEGSEGELMLHPTGRRYPASGAADLEKYFSDYSVVLVGDPALAASEIDFFKGKNSPSSFGFLDATHPLRRKLEEIARSKETRGAFVFYRLRDPYSPR